MATKKLPPYVTRKQLQAELLMLARAVDASLSALESRLTAAPEPVALYHDVNPSDANPLPPTDSEGAE